MAKIAIIKTGGKQYLVKEGQPLKIEKLNEEINKTVKFETLLIASEDGKNMDLGKPTLGEKVSAKIVGEGKDKKVAVLKYKNKTRYIRNKGHRQQFSKVMIEKIG